MPFCFANWAIAVAVRWPAAAVRTKFRSPVGYRCSRSSGVLTPRTSRVRVVPVLAGLIIASGPFGAWFATGISCPEQPEL